MMKELQVVTEQNNLPVDVTNYKEVAIEWLTSMGMNLKENHKKQFIDICCAFGLNPIKKEVYGVPYGDKFNVIVGYESYIKRAERSGRLDGWKVEIVGSGNDMKAVITIERKDWTHPFVHEVYFDEYNTNQSLWKSKPRTMLKKVAIAQGFRMCFSEELGGMPYTSDELPEEMTTPSTNVENQSSYKSSDNKAKKFTKEQGEKLGSIVKTVLADGTPAFSKEEQDSYRQMLMNGLFEDAFTSASELLQKRQSEFIPSKEDIESELN